MPIRKKPLSFKDSKDPENIHNPSNEDDESGSGTIGGSGGSGEIRWKDPLAGRTRDDLLPPTEKRRLLHVHESANKILVDKQKYTIEERKLLKDGVRQTQRQSYGLGTGAGGSRSQYKDHPTLAKKSRGLIDNQVSPFANENKSDTNPELKQANELKNQLKLQHSLQYRSTPKNRPPGM